MSDNREFKDLALRAIDLGLLTEEEVALISRAGTRKSRYQARHLVDLRRILTQRLIENPELFHKLFKEH